MSDNNSNHDHLEPQLLAAPNTLLSLLQFLSPYKRQIFIFLIALLITAGITLSIGQGLRLLIDGGFADKSEDNLNTAVLFIIGLAVLMAAGTYVRFYLISWLGERVSADIRTAVFDHVITLHPAFFETNRSGDIMSRLTSDTTLLQSIIGSSMSIALRSGISSLGALIMLLATNFKLSLIVLLSIPLILLPILYFGRRVRTLSRQSQDSIASVGSYAGEVIQQIKIVQSFTQESFEKAAFGEEVERAFSVAKKRIGQRAILTAMVILAIFGALSAMLWFGGRDVMSGAMSGGDLGAFIFYATLMALGVASLSEVYGELQRAAGATERLMELLHAPNEIVLAELITADVVNLQASITFNDVNFCYPSRPNQAALTDFSLTIPDGKIIALVGPSGAGKSTLFALIQRFYESQQGNVQFGGVDIRELDLEGLRQQIAVVDQQPTLFTGDVMYNIRYGKLGASDEEVIDAAKAAHADEFIRQLPNGYTSNLGEQGVRLSGGQRQRIVIARALLREPSLLILDEATSQIDAESEEQINLAIAKFRSGRTLVVIAHRLSTVLAADRIVVMDEGRTMDVGTHSELMGRCEVYRRLAQTQLMPG